MKKLIIFNDLGGTLLDRATYSCQSAYPALQLIREKNIPLVFGDMTAAEVGSLTGLNSEQAAMAKARDVDEPFIFNGSSAKAVKLCARIRSKGFNSTKVMLFHILGDSDKGKAVDILTALFRQKWNESVLQILRKLDGEWDKA